jgi:hypothetical protein
MPVVRIGNEYCALWGRSMTPIPLPRSTVALFDWATAVIVGTFIAAILLAAAWGLG